VRYAVFTSAGGAIAPAFLSRAAARLESVGIELGCVVVDQNVLKQSRPLSYSWRISRRRARLSGCTPVTAFIRGALYRLMVQSGTPSKDTPEPRPHPALRVASLNDGRAAAYVAAQHCDVVCLMGTRILTRATLEAIGRPVINIHSADPAFVRGGPPVVWEILAGRDSIVLTVHNVIEEVDAGGLLVQKEHPISFSGGLGSTVGTTMAAAVGPVSELFERALLGMRDQFITATAFTPGTFRTVPSVAEQIRAEVVCRRRSRFA
jgi:hypothetical protein